MGDLKATVSVYIGQCGNQVGYQIDRCRLMHELDKHTARKGQASTPHGPPHLAARRAICVDSEYKVVTGHGNIQLKLPPTKGVKPFIYEQKIISENIIQGRRGRGNNWALGYEGIGTEKILEACLDRVRKEAERCDMFTNILMAHSLCGGTGGGLGSRIAEELREEFPLQQMVSCVVAPYSSGDTPLQHYNSLLSLTALHKFTDAVFLFRNDTVQAACSSKCTDSNTNSAAGGTRTPANESISFAKMNEYIANCIAGITIPTDTLTPPSQISCELELSEVIRSICPQQNLKFLTVSHCSKQSDDLRSLCHAVTSLLKQTHMGKQCQSLANLMVIRGPQAQQIYPELPNIELRLKKELRAVTWNPFPVDFWLASRSLKPRNPRKTSSSVQPHDITILSNYSNIIEFTEHVRDSARLMYTERAYLHWYKKYNVTEEHFEEAFDTTQELIDCYKDAIR